MGGRVIIITVGAFGHVVQCRVSANDSGWGFNNETSPILTLKQYALWGTSTKFFFTLIDPFKNSYIPHTLNILGKLFSPIFEKLSYYFFGKHILDCSRHVKFFMSYYQQMLGFVRQNAALL